MHQVETDRTLMLASQQIDRVNLGLTDSRLLDVVENETYLLVGFQIRLWTLD